MKRPGAAVAGGQKQKDLSGCHPNSLIFCINFKADIL
jgi:hypothetical protein